MSADLLKKYTPVLAMLAGVGSLILLLGESEHQQLLTLVLIWSTFTLGWNVLGGFGGQMSAGHALFFGIGAFVPALMMVYWGITPAIGIWVGLLAAVAAALIVGWATFRLSGIYFTLATLVIPLMVIPIIVRFGLHELSIPFIRENPSWYFQFPSATGPSYLALAAVCVALGLTVWLKHSKLGLNLQAVRDNEVAAEAAGVPTFQAKMRGLVLSAALSSIAGTLMVTSVLFVVTPHYVFGLLLSVNVIVMTFVGGTSTVWGPVIGAALIVPAADLLTARYGATLPGLNGALLGVVLVLTVLFAPGGVYGRAQQLFGRRRSTRSDGTAKVGSRVERPEAATPPTQPKDVVAAGSVSTTDVVLSTERLSRHYGGLRAVDEVSLEVFRGEILGIIGPNGAGKTTLFDVICGQVPESAGVVNVGATDSTGLPPHQLCRLGVARTFQVVRTFPELSLLDNVRVGALPRAEASRGDAIEIALECLGFVGLREDPHQPVSSLNTADLRRMELARALASRPEVLLADECLAGLSGSDVEAVVALLRAIQRQGVTVVVIEHTMSAMVGLVDRFIVLNHGRVIANDVPDRVVKDPKVVEAYLGKKWAEASNARG